MERSSICELYAKVYLLNDEDKKLDFVETVPEAKQLQVRKHLREVGEKIFQKAIKSYMPEQEYEITWDGLYITVEFTDFKAKEILPKLISSIHQTRIEVYDGKYICFDNFSLICNRMQGLTKMTTKRYKEHWEWRIPPPKLKEWNMWATEEGKDSISIRNNTNPIPHGKEIVTRKKTIWFDWGDNTTAIFSKEGFTVSDVIKAIQKIITQEYETELGEDMMEDNEIGSIDILYYNPRTRHVSISVTFD